MALAHNIRFQGDSRRWQGAIPHRHLRPNTVVYRDCAMYIVLSRRGRLHSAAQRLPKWTWVVLSVGPVLPDITSFPHTKIPCHTLPPLRRKK